jgi:hypothetical protein
MQYYQNHSLQVNHAAGSRPGLSKGFAMCLPQRKHKAKDSYVYQRRLSFMTCCKLDRISAEPMLQRGWLLQQAGGICAAVSNGYSTIGTSLAPPARCIMFYGLVRCTSNRQMSRLSVHVYYLNLKQKVGHRGL